MKKPVTYVAPGYGVDACPGCGEKPKPGEERTVVPGEWWPWHTACYREKVARDLEDVL